MNMNSIKTNYSDIYSEKNPVKGSKVKKENTANIEEADKKLISKEISQEVSYEQNVKNDVGNKPNAKTVEQLRQESDALITNFQNMIRDMLEKQGFHFKKFMGLDIENKKEIPVDLRKSVSNKLNIKVDDSTRLKAQQAISDGGAYSIDAVSTRILDFAKALSNGDSSKIDKLREAVKKGFEQARKMFGGKLPEISEKTYDEVMKRFDDWQKEKTSQK